MFDRVTGVRPLVGVLIAELHVIGIEPVVIDKLSGDTSASDLRIVGHVHVVADGLATGEDGAFFEGTVSTVQVGVGEVAHIFDHH